jgi:hypothetical protein
VPEELQRRESRIERIRAAKAELEREAAAARAQELRANAAGQREKSTDPAVLPIERKRAATRAAKSETQADEIDDDDGDDSGASASSELATHRVPHSADGRPKPESQRNFTDPESRIMVKHGAYVQAYNAQAVVDDTAQVIVAQAVTNQAPDQQHLVPMLKLVQNTVGESPIRASADSGYFTAANVEYCDKQGIDAYVSVGRIDHHGQTRFNAAAAPSEARDRMQAKLTSRLGRAYYRRRKVIVEPVFGQIEQARGFRRFSLRGLRKTGFEWALVCLTHNLLKLFRFGAPQPA